MTITDEPVTGELVQYQPQAVEEYRPRILMAPGEAREIDQALRDMMKAVLHEGTDYGVIPGTGNKPSLLKPGAEKLLQWFGFGHTMERVEIEHSPAGERLGVTYRCTVTKAMPDGRVIVVATCEGYAGYDEDRFFSTAEDSRAKAERKERANAEKYRRPVNPSKWEYITEDFKAPWNSVIKMSQKRALVGAALQATSGSTLFTQDVEDNTEPAAPGASIASAASEVIAALPEEARRGVEAWRKQQDWPRSSEWEPGQWCAALIQAGRIDALLPGSAARSEAVQQANDDIWTTPSGPGDGWADEAVGLVLNAPDVDACRMLYRQAVARADAGEITVEDKERICELATARVKDLQAQPVEGAVSAPDGDPWQAKLEEIASTADADAVIAELDTQHKGGLLDSRRHKALRAAARARGEAA